jgi:hypothetical protein
MHLLILSNRFDKEVVQLWIGYQAATDGVDIKCHTLSRVMSSALFDYHVTIVDLSLDYPNRFTPVTLEELPLALEQGRTIIFITGTPPRSVQDTSIYGRLKSVNVYPQAAIGRNIQFTQHGKAQIFQDYFQNVNEYLAHWTATDEAISEKTIAVIADTELVIAAEYSIGKGKIVVLPPTSYDETVAHQVIPSLYNMARKYYEDMQKRVFVGDEPAWVEKHKTQEHLQIIDNIEDLELRKQGLDMIIYLLYGTGPELEDSVKLTLERLGLEVEKTPPGANIDFTARNADETIKLAIEVTGTVDKIKQGSRKVPQAWMYHQERQDEQEKLVLMANTYRCLPIEDRSGKLHFTPHVKKIFTQISALLMTTAYLYSLWKDVQEQRRTPDEVLKLLYDSAGVLEIPSS